MSEEAPQEAAVAEEVPAEAAAACPIGDEFLPPNMKKHVDPKAPVPLRGMAAKGLIPLGASDMVQVLFMLMYDPDAGIREQAGKTASTLADRIAASAFRDERIKPVVLGWYMEVYGGNDGYAEMLILNASTPDESVAAVASWCSKRTAEIIGQNQLRILRHDDIIRNLAKNPEAQGALIDGVCDFAVRNGLNLPDVPQLQEARVRLFGPQAAAAPVQEVDEGPTADQVIEEMESLAPEGGAPPEEGVRLTLSQRVMKMNVSEKIKLATKGNKEARSLLIRDSNKLVSSAVMRSPRITEGEVLVQAMNKIASDEVLRIIVGNREWMRQYPIKLAIVKNPKVPQSVSMRLLNQLHESDIKGLAKDKNVPGTVQMMAKKMIDQKKNKSGGGGGGH